MAWGASSCGLMFVIPLLLGGRILPIGSLKAVWPY
jgi:hypothetical protein